MVDGSQEKSPRHRYVMAINGLTDAIAILISRYQSRTMPTDAELQRVEDARVILKAAKAEFLNGLDRW
jgi:hypothetical protein